MVDYRVPRCQIVPAVVAIRPVVMSTTKMTNPLHPRGKSQKRVANSKTYTEHGRSMLKMTMKEYAVLCAPVYCEMGSMCHLFWPEYLNMQS